jgi:hypothetical protein
MNLQLAYVAGFFDGEGSIGIYRGGGTAGRTLRCQITQNISPQSTDPLTACRERWGGSLAVMNRRLKSPAYNWQVNGPKAMGLLCDLRPFLLLKAAQADVAIEWQQNKPTPGRGPDGRMLPQAPDVTTYHDGVAAQLAALKHGVPIDEVLEDAGDLVEIRQSLRQVVNVKGD